MIRFDLTCDNAHRFDSWFRSGADCEDLLDRGLVNCTTCGSSMIRKALMAPKVVASDTIATTPKLRAPNDASPLEVLKRKIEESADDVGTSFAKEARDMHDGVTPERPIFGQASGQEAKELLSDGVPVLPLPFVPTKKSN